MTKSDTFTTLFTNKHLTYIVFDDYDLRNCEKINLLASSVLSSVMAYDNVMIAGPDLEYCKITDTVVFLNR